MKGPFLTNHQVRRIAELWAADKRVSDIAKDVGVSTATIYYQVSKLPPRSFMPTAGRPPTVNMTLLELLVLGGIPQEYIARRFGVTPAAIHYAVKRVKKNRRKRLDTLSGGL